MRLLYVSLFLLLLTNPLRAQEESRIYITPYIDTEMTNFNASTANIVENRLKRIVSDNGMGATGEYPRFILTSDINISDKQITASAPPIIAVTLDVTLFLGDGIEGVLFSSYTTSVKGVGRTEDQAYKMALNKISPRSQEIQDFLAASKSEITAYYEDQCELIIEQSKNKASRGNFDEAIYDLLEVPSVAKTCYSKTLDLAVDLTRRKLEAQCAVAISNSESAIAKGNWKQAISSIEGFTPALTCYPKIEKLYDKIATERCEDIIGKARSSYAGRDFSEASKILASVSNSASCSKAAENLLTHIKSELDDQAQRKWDLAYEKYDRDQTLKEQNSKFDQDLAMRKMDYAEKQGFELKKQQIMAARDIGVAFGKNQPRRVTYNVKGW